MSMPLVGPMKEESKRRRRKAGRVLLVVAAVLAAAGVVSAGWLGSTLYGFFSSVQQVPPDPQPQEQPGVVADRPINILVLGVDAGAGAGEPPAPQRSDTIMVVNVNPATGRVGLLSIPRDTRVEIPGRPEPEKIAHAHAYGQAEGGPGAGARRVAETVENFLGIQIDYFVEVDFDAFRALVDAVGGVEVCIDKPMHYTARSQNLRIDLQPGCQTLDGDKALQYVRYRQDGDIFRIQRQQQFLKALVDKVLSMQGVLKLPQLASTLGRQVTTDMPTSRMLGLVALLPKFDPSALEMGILPGRPGYLDGLSYWLVEPEEARREAMKILAGIDVEANAQVRLEVLNGNGRRGAASSAADLLRGYGFQVVTVGNAGRFDFQETTVLVRPGDTDVGERLRQVLDPAAASVRVETTADLPEGVDARIVVGQDFTGTATGSAAGSAATGAAPHTREG
ncbi:cell envelope-related transcriptional attenuator [Thermaerobacter marianensis DSM 12885]|uniref:Cell envelope-related transcriptional attenuator n=2 Tax=Thermaerobacter marianensis TaxID=73919 RepID=E6SKC1_THEM7|nr:cell envelope-related transcriptional attenuator [Thermaerobacter marianensis DSM 12885]